MISSTIGPCEVGGITSLPTVIVTSSAQASAKYSRQRWRRRLGLCTVITGPPGAFPSIPT